MTNAPLVFYIDDDQDDLLLFEFAASNLNIDLRLFENSDELFKALNATETKPTIIFVDLNMPIKSGFEIIQEIKSDENLKQIPIVVLSTAGDHFTAEKSRKTGANYYIQKPTSHTKLSHAISYALGIDWNDFDSGTSDFVHKQ